MNAMESRRDYTRPLEEIRERERGLTDCQDRGRGTVCFPEMRKSGIGICVATQIARYVKPESKLSGCPSPEQALVQTQGQLAWYRAMEERGELSPITTAVQLQAALNVWTNNQPNDAPIYYLLSLEGAGAERTAIDLRTTQGIDRTRRGHRKCVRCLDDSAWLAFRLQA